MRRLVSAALAALAALAGAIAGPVFVTAAPTASATATVATGAPCAGVTQPPANWPATDPGKVFQCSYSQDGLTRTAFVYQPRSWQPRSHAPAIVVLHGCTQLGPDIAALSRFDVEAEKRGFIVVYPNQADFTSTGTTSFDGNGSHCWNWFLPQAQSRGAGEPALIAGLTGQATRQWHTDLARTFVIGISAGGAMSNIMAATYPELYAAAGVMAGCEFRGLPCMGSASALPPQVSAQLAYQAAGSHARVVPFLVENGDADPAVPVGNAFEVVQQMQLTADYAAHHGTLSSPVPSQSCAQKTVVPSSPVDTIDGTPVARNPYEIFYYSADGAPCPKAITKGTPTLGELWVIHGEGHAWPGGPLISTSNIYSNPGGPDFSGAAYRFFMAHPCAVKHGVCAAA